MQMCISAAEDDIRVKCMKVVHSMLKEEVDKAQSLSSSSHDKAIKVIIQGPCRVQRKSVLQLACHQQAFTGNYFPFFSESSGEQVSPMAYLPSSNLGHPVALM